jgi:hypothetical protein
MRRRLFLLFLLSVIAVVGCNRFSGPLETRQMGRADPKDEKGRPIYSIGEQQQRGRERLSITEDDYRIGPKGYIDRPSPIGR